jgi:hypothetical protein
MVAGAVSMIIGVGFIFGMVAVAGDIWYVPALIGWLFAGLGIGFGLTTAAAVALAESSMLLGDLIGASVGVGIGGVLLAWGERNSWSSPDSVSLAMLPGLALLAVALFAAIRISQSRERVAAPRRLSPVNPQTLTRTNPSPGT